MKLSDFNYNLPSELIAQEPVSPRDHSRLLIYNRLNQEVQEKKFYQIIDYLQAGDILFLNNSKVFPARLKAKKKTGGKIELFLLKNINPEENIWQGIIGGKLGSNLELDLEAGLKAKIIEEKDGFYLFSFNRKYTDFIEIINKIGQTPLPPYIKRDSEHKNDSKNYQTVYANDQKIGSSAAPTAGLHFTNKLLKKIKEKGVEILEGTLYVGWGTFSAIKTENLKKHKMHRESGELSSSVLKKIITAKKEGRRIVAVGTTSARILESFFASGFKNSSVLAINTPQIKKSQNFLEKLNQEDFSIFFSTNIFIYPAYQFKAVDALITNFHLPQSSLIIMISALIGREKTLEIYQEAIEKKYRFFSYGDAMFII